MNIEKKENFPRFPLFVDISGWNVLVFGGGGIAARRVRTLSLFGPSVRIISDGLCPSLAEDLPAGCTWEQRRYIPGEIPRDGSVRMVLAATGDPEVNRQITAECRGKGIPANNASDREDCDFYFPAVIQEDNMILGLTSDGSDHRKVRKTAAQLRDFFRTAGPACESQTEMPGHS